MADDPTDVDERTPEERAEWQRIIGENLQMISQHIDAGWSWGRNTMTHPTDPALHYWIEPYSQKLVLSPNLAGQMTEEMLRQLKADHGGEFKDGQ